MSQQGIVKWYSLARGYGFIRLEDRDEDPGDDIFVHHSEVPGDPLVEGERVSFEIVDGPRGPKARNVRRLSPEAASIARRE